MSISSFLHRQQVLSCAALLGLVVLILPLHAQTPAKKPAAPAAAKPPAAPAVPKPATPSPASHSASPSTAAHTGTSTTTTTSHTGTTTTSGTHTGPTTSNPGSAAKTTTTTTTTTTSGSVKTPTTTTDTKSQTTTKPAATTDTKASTTKPPTTTTKQPTGQQAQKPTPPGPNGRVDAKVGTGREPGRNPAVSPTGRPMPGNVHEVRLANGSRAVIRPNGVRSDFHDERRGMDIHRNLNGERRISVERADHSRIFAERGGRGYVQHPYSYRGREFGRRTYYYNGRAYDRFYGRYPYRGAYLDVYYPPRYYAPAFYGWAYNPWATPINYAWGWNAAPWYGYYGPAYFAPYPVYPSAAFWLTDYLISQSLQAAYQAQVEAGQAAPLVGATPLTPDIKKMVSDEVQRQVALENVEATQNAQKQDIDAQGSSIARLLSDNQPHVFIAGASLDLVNAAGTECAVSQGDVLEVAAPPPADATAATALVLTTKGGKECAKSDTVQIAFTDLQDMQNHMRETIDAGLGDLQTKQGQGGLPVPPPSAKAPPVDSQFAAAAPPPDPNAATEIKQQLQEADKAEQEVATLTPPATPGASGPSDTPAPVAAATTPTLKIGQSVESMEAAMGKPTKVLDKGASVIYVYPDMKVTIKGGKIADMN